MCDFFFQRKGSIFIFVIVSRNSCLLYTSPSPRDGLLSRMPSSASVLLPFARYIQRAIYILSLAPAAAGVWRTNLRKQVCSQLYSHDVEARALLTCGAHRSFVVVVVVGVPTHNNEDKDGSLSLKKKVAHVSCLGSRIELIRTKREKSKPYTQVTARETTRLTGTDGSRHLETVPT